MKKFLSVLLVLAMVFSFAACGKKEEPAPKGPGCYVTIVKGDGEFAIAHEFVEFVDENADGKNNIDEVLKAAHTQYGKVEDYASADTEWGRSITKLWGDDCGSYGYYNADQMAMSLDDEVIEGTYVVAFVYQDQVNWSDAYSFIDSCVYENGKLTVHVNKMGFDENWMAVPTNAEGVEVFIDGTSVGTTDAEGNVTVSISGDKKEFTVTTKAAGLVPAVAEVAL